MSDADRLRWDGRYARRGSPAPGAVGLPAVFAGHADEFPVAGTALEVACGQGGAAVWLARRGLTVLGADVSPVAIGHARRLAAACGVADRCRFVTADLDEGLPDGRFDVVLCHLFRDPALDRALVGALGPGGLLAVAALSEAGAGPGRYRAAAGELTDAYAGLDVLDAGQADGIAWLLARSRINSQ